MPPHGLESFRRFTMAQRIEHGILALSFAALSLTGLVQKYATNSWSERLIAFMGGIEMTRVLHRAAAVVFALLAVYHILVVAYKFFVRRVAMTLMPSLGDITDGLRFIGSSLSRRRESPQLPRYSFVEKLEYWALVWGGLIMLMTGFMLWNPLLTTLFLPGQVIPAAKAAHGGEAVLAVLAIIVWHFYHVHLRTFNKSMFTGNLTRHQMEAEHGAEWRGYLAGVVPPGPSPAALRRRRIVFIPSAILFAALGTGGIYWAATAEATAITTVPAPASPAEVFSPATSTPPDAIKPAGVAAPPVPHPIEGQERCFACHGGTGASPVPADHEGRPVESCLICHELKPVAKPAVPASAKPGEPEAQQASGPRPVPHPMTGPYENCLDCHGIGKLKPFPENHSAYPVTSCAACHR